jgi:hypothetical protein
MCVGTATLILSGSGSAGGALALGCLARRTRWFRALRSRLLRRA